MSSPLAAFRAALAEGAVSALDLPPALAPSVAAQIRVPEAGRGDLALPCFLLGKELKQPPPAIAPKVAEALDKDPRYAAVEAVGPYVNVSFSTEHLIGTVLPLACAGGYGDHKTGVGKTVTIDFSSPNIAKPLAFHHLRSTVIGAAIGRLHAACGWTVEGINYLGDWGKQFGLLATGFQRYGDPARRGDAKHLIEVYVKANKDADVGGRKETIARPAEVEALVERLKEQSALSESAEGKDKKKATRAVKSLTKKLLSMRGMEAGDPLSGLSEWMDELKAAAAQAEAELPAAEARDHEAREFLRRMEDKEPEALAEWREFRQTSIDQFNKVYARLGVEFSRIEGESFYQDVLQTTLDRVKEKPGTKESEGALIIDMPVDKGEPPAIVQTRDGTTLYITRDIAAAMDRFDRFQFERSLYVVAADQRLHFKQLYRALAEMGFEWAERCTHVAFGRVHGMSTRKGQIIFLDEVLDEAVAKAREISEASEKILPEHLDEAVEDIGVGAIVFGDLCNLRTSDYTFRWEEVLNFSGHSGPYVQFSHARTCSILDKAGGAPEEADLSKLTLPEERALVMALMAYPDAVLKACDSFEPSLLTRALLQIAQSTASYLTAGNRDRSWRVLTEDMEVRGARLMLVDAVRRALSHGLQILGVRARRAM